MNTMRNYVLLVSLCLLAAAGCTSPPPPVSSGGIPALLELSHIEAGDTGFLAVYFRLRAENTRTAPLVIETGTPAAFLNGRPSGAVTEITGGKGTLHIEPGTSDRRMLVLKLNMKELADTAGEAENHAELRLPVAWRYGGAQSTWGELSAAAVFPPVREPEFAITSIAILQSELINTRFRVTLKIDNPNVFPLTLSALNYELYGEGHFWAQGREQDVLYIPARSSAETELRLMMNFIDMPRRVFDGIIAMRKMNYRFTGTVDVSANLPMLPHFRTGFDKSGQSEVLK